MVSRTGFTGDLGYELWVKPELALDLWDELYAAGDDYGIQPFGEEATNMARLEAGFIMPDVELHEALKTIHFEHDQSPFELNLGWLVDFKKPHFNGRKALLEEKERGPNYTLTRLDLPETNPPWRQSCTTTSVVRRLSVMSPPPCGHPWSRPTLQWHDQVRIPERRHLGGSLLPERAGANTARSCCARSSKSNSGTPARARATPPADY